MESQNWTDCMVDIETTGLQPDRSAIIQIAAVKFNLATREVCPNFFNRSLKMAKHRSWDEGTRAWWSKMPSLYSQIVMAGEEPALVMRDFALWSQGNMRFWAKPLSFDYPFISSYMHDYDQIMSFDHRDGMDMRSYIRGLFSPFPVDWNDEPPFVGTPHDALYDTLHQVKVLFHYQDKSEGIIDAEFESQPAITYQR